MTRLRAKFALFIIAIGVVGFGVWKLSGRDQTPPAAASPQPEHRQTAGKPQLMSTPTVLRIPKLGLRAKIQAVGLNPQGNMGAPRNVTDVAWYKGGPIPGNQGNAVIAGHFGKPHQAAFWNLDSLNVGDRIEVTDSAQTVARFTVTQVQRVKPDLATRDHIFGQTTETHLNLITCGGTWHEASKSYSERLVVFSTRVN